MAVPIALAPDGHAVEAGQPVALFSPHIALGTVPGPAKHQYAVARDGQRFLINSVEEDRSAPITVVLNWTAGLKK